MTLSELSHALEPFASKIAQAVQQAPSAVQSVEIILKAGADFLMTHRHIADALVARHDYLSVKEVSGQSLESVMLRLAEIVFHEISRTAEDPPILWSIFELLGVQIVPPRPEPELRRLIGNAKIRRQITIDQMLHPNG